MIEIRRLTKYFGSLCAVDHIDLDVENEIFGLLGPNGAGKSTTVMMLTTLLKPSEGSARVCGYDVVHEATKVRKTISYVPQDMAVDIKLTGRENVQLYAKLYRVPDREKRVNDVLGLSFDFKPKFAKQYANLEKIIREALNQYKKEIKEGIFPDKEHSYDG